MGSSNSIRWPGIWLHPNSGTDGNSLAGFRLHCPGVPNSVPGALNLEQTYHIVIEYTQSWLYVEIDGESVYDASHQTHTNYDEMVVYGSDPWYGAADVTVSNVIIWSGGIVSFLNAHSSNYYFLSLHYRMVNYSGSTTDDGRALCRTLACTHSGYCACARHM